MYRSSVLQPNSPQAMIKTALESANKSRLVSSMFLSACCCYVRIETANPGLARSSVVLFIREAWCRLLVVGRHRQVFSHARGRRNRMESI